jgi:signal transduction histidine kinase
VDLLFKKADKLSIDNFDSCLNFCNQEINETQIQELKYALLLIKGKAHYFKGNYDSAAIFYNKGINELEKSNSNNYLAFGYNELAKLYRKTKKYDEALINYDKALEIYLSKKDTAGISMIYNESGVVFEYKKDYEEALLCYNKSYELCKNTNDTTGQAYALNFIGIIYSYLKDYKNAAMYFDNSIFLHKKKKDTYALGSCYIDKANLYTLSNQFIKANLLLDSTILLSTEMNYLDLLSASYLQKSTIDSLTGNYANAFIHFKKHTAIKDSIFTTANNKVIEELNTQYNTAKKEQTIINQSNNINRKNSIILFSTILFFLLSILGFNFYKRKKSEQAIILQQEISTQQEIAIKEVIEAEERERKRIASDLHDGVGQLLTAAKFNLSGISNQLTALTETQKNIFEKALSMVDESAKEVRLVSHNIMPNALIKRGLANTIKEFIEKIENNAIKINLQTEGLQNELAENTEIVIYRVIQECVNNVIKHSKANTLDISIINDAEGLAVSLEDNGIGFDNKLLDKIEGIGLKNIQSRINYLKGSVEFDSQLGNGTLVSIFIPHT